MQEENVLSSIFYKGDEQRLVVEHFPFGGRPSRLNEQLSRANPRSARLKNYGLPDRRLSWFRRPSD
ncbi:MAG: hypothetical protein KatS3mg130_1162 [Candidatus Sumerlaea sp.]|uniref:Uncharacterized protein n=1 Tax=Sumerlaea chitinivorans TaxID=2250252 RepID=A0A2Z4Y1R5_SUMC1|nr:hypothetical protein BRCON_0031 [Candidatus Sumerlaea chitinivorans]GIX44754.1 MAG: hypothetical protein KatS3mg130_1162 [Candidatus Sumerlaea sp.]